MYRTLLKLTMKMMMQKYFALFLTLVLFKTVDGEDINTRPSLSSEVAQPIQRRYSEAILASDYSRSVDNMLKKNFVDWLLRRREKKSENISNLTKRQVDFQLPDLNMDKNAMDKPEESKNYMSWLLKEKHINSFHNNNVKAAVCQDTLDLFMAMDLCNGGFQKNNVKTAVCQETLDLLMAMDLCSGGFP